MIQTLQINDEKEGVMIVDNVSQKIYIIVRHKDDLVLSEATTQIEGLFNYYEKAEHLWDTLIRRKENEL